MLGLYLDTLIISHKFCSVLKSLPYVVSIDFWQYKVEVEVEDAKWIKIPKGFAKFHDKWCVLDKKVKKTILRKENQFLMTGKFLISGFLISGLDCMIFLVDSSKMADSGNSIL